MRNLIETFRKKLQIDRIFNIDKSRSKSIYDVLRPINILNIIFGIRVFAVPRGHSRPILSFIYSMLCFSLAYSVWSSNDKKIDRTKIHCFDKTIEYVSALINHIMIFAIAIIGLYQTETLKLCGKKMHEIDKTLVALGSSSSFDQIYKKTIIEIIFYLLYVMLIFTITIRELYLLNLNDYMLSFRFYLSLFQYFYGLMIEFLILIEFCTMIRCVKSEYQRANELLSDVNILPISSIASELIERSFIVDSNKLFRLSSSLPKMHSRLQVESHKINRSRKLLQTIRQVHLELYKISKSFDKIYGIQISFEIAMCIFYNIQLLYNIYIKYLNQSHELFNIIFLLDIRTLTCLQYSIRIFAINRICDKTTKEAELTNEIIHTFYGRNTDLVIRREVEIFSMQMMQCHTSYSAFGLYNFGCKHICSCIGVIATYVVIMVQVSDSLKKES